MMYEAGETTPEELSVLRAQRDWPARIEAAHTIPREVMSVRDYSVRAQSVQEPARADPLPAGRRQLSYYMAATKRSARHWHRAGSRSCPSSSTKG